MKKRVTIAEDDEGLRELLSRSIRRSKDFTLHHAFASAEEALAVLLDDPPDIIVADWRLAGPISGFELIARLKHLHPQLFALAISGFKLAELPVDAVLAGADSFLRKPVCGPELLVALRQLLAGQCPFSQVAVALLRARLREQAEWSPLPVGPLSPQEHRVLAGLARGQCGKQVADELGLAWGTFLTYRDRAFKKLNAHSLLEAVQHLRRWAAVPLPLEGAARCNTFV